MKVEYGKIVVIEYRVRLSSGQMVDSSEKSGKPLKFVCGQGDFPAPVEEGIIGLTRGESKVITVPPTLGYGVYDPKKVRLVATEQIFGAIEIGNTVKTPNEFGLRRPAVVRSIWQGAVLVDFNHPFAGKTLYFEIKIKEVFHADQQKNREEVYADGNSLEESRAQRNI